jgi:hypothetical protein
MAGDTSDLAQKLSPQIIEWQIFNKDLVLLPASPIAKINGPT